MPRVSLLLIALAAGCAPTTRIAGSRATGIDRATWQARAAFDAATRAGDTSRVAALFAANAVLISPRGDSIRGGDAITRYLAGLGQGPAPVAFTFGRDGSLETCLGAARERLAYTAQVDPASGTPRSVSGNVAVLWKRDSTGDLKVAWVDFRGADARRRLSRAECPSVADSVWRAWRWGVSVVPIPIGELPGPERSFVRTLRARGWVDVACSCLNTTPIFTPLSDKTRFLPPGLLSVQYHWGRHLIAEVLGGRTPQGTTMGARTLNGEYSQTRLTYSGAFVAALIAYQSRGMQVGVGPALQFAQWQLRDSVVPSGGYPTATNYEWSSHPVGIVADARLQRPAGNRSFMMLRAGLRAFPRSKTPATPRFPTVGVDQGVAFVGVGFGILR